MCALADGENKKMRTCAFTGHRAIKAEHEAELVDRLARAVAYCYKEGVRTFFCGGAVGFDMLAAREVLRFRIYHPDVMLNMLLPCPEQDKKWSNTDRENYAFLLRNADSVEYVSDTYTADCMKKRNRRLCEKCDVLVAYLFRPRSGAGQTVRMAKELGKTVYNLSPTIEVERQ